MSDFKLKLKGKALVLIDWANLRNQQGRLGWQIDLEKLYGWLIGHEEVDRVMFFYGFEESHPASKKFLKKVESLCDFTSRLCWTRNLGIQKDNPQALSVYS